MSKNSPQLRIVSRSSKSAPPAPAQPLTVSPRWLLSAIGITLLAAVLCAWASLCLLFWQGSWQLLYHPQSTVAHTPASVGLQYDALGFAATDTGQLRLQGWWIPAAPGAPFDRYTVLYFHGQNGNLGDTVAALKRIHAVGVNVFAFDYRGYGQSQFAHPSEANWRQDTSWALGYLTGTRHVDPHTIVLDGDELGANLAAEEAAADPRLAGVVLESPLEDAMGTVFNDPRARLVPAHELVHDRYDLRSAAATLRVPSLWFLPAKGNGANAQAAYKEAPAAKMLVWLNSEGGESEFSDAYSGWLNKLPAR